MKPYRLYYFHRPGCSWCKKGRPIVDTFVRAHPECLLVPHNLDARPGGVKGFVPSGTPAYLVVRDEEPVGGETGMLELSALEAFVKEALDSDDEDSEDEEEDEDDDSEEE